MKWFSADSSGPAWSGSSGLVVQKYGGTSVATAAARERVIVRIGAAVQAGKKVVAVVSAMGRKGDAYATDTLLGLLEHTVCEQREKDLLFSCGEIIAGVVLTAELQASGYDAVFLSGQQAGIVTDDRFGNAEVQALNPDAVFAHLNAGRVVIVGGAQGGTLNGEVTSLGRGGSDVTACVLGIALAADRVEIYTDVSGIMTADPKVSAEAKLLPLLSYQECHRLAAAGAKVLHPKAVEIAARRPETILWVGSVEGGSGTLVGFQDSLAMV